MRAALRATSPSLVAHLSKHRAITRLALAGLALAVALGVSLQDAAAGIPRPNPHSMSILPASVGTGILTTDPVTVTFAQPVDANVVDSAITLEPAAAFEAMWNEDHTSLTLTPHARWQTDQRYVISLPSSPGSGTGRSVPVARQVTFTTQTAPVITDFRVHLVDPDKGDVPLAMADLSRSIPQGEAAGVLGDSPLIDTPEDTAHDASANTGIHIGFNAGMNRADVESRFHIRPHVQGEFSWNENQLTFTPGERLVPGERYAITVVGAHDLQGNRLDGDVAFSFTTRSDAELVRFTPDRHAKNVTARQVVIQFSEPMNPIQTKHALRVRDLDAARWLTGSFRWNRAHTRLEFQFDEALPRGHTVEVRLTRRARDMDGNRVSVSWRFQTRAPSTAAAPSAVEAPAPVRGGPNAPADTLSYALWLINQARSQYGFAPLRLDAAVSDVAAGHAWDQIRYNYFSHTGRDGSHVSDRLRAAGIGFSWSGENMCYYNGLGLRAMLDWCQGTFMAEPYPGYANHIGNILSSHYNRVGIGIAQSGGKVIIVWDFAG
ncbi:MAG TPA: Ig-like domain-containing protein [Candidatus Limnocylindria bacterium]